jgi:hypothetical protein
MKQFLCISLLLLLGGTSYAATHEAKKTETSIEQSIDGANGEGLTVVSSAIPVKMISSRFSCSKKLEGCFLFLMISYDGIVGHSEQPKVVVVDGVAKDGVKGIVSVVGLHS